MRGRAVLVAMLACGALACSAPSQQQYDAGMARFDALSDEAKAYVCADDWYAVQYGIEGFALVERCGAGREPAVTRAEDLSASFESADQRYASTYYEQNPPTARQLRGIDETSLCGTASSQTRADIEQWRERTDFPRWDGVEYVPSVEHEVAKLQIWRDAACPLLQQEG